MVITRSRWWALAAALVVCLGTARLGWWQLDRAAQKTQLQQLLQSQRALAPLLQADLERGVGDDPAALLHRAVRLQGRWLPEHTVYLDNRQMLGRTGFYAVTPLLLEGGAAVLVQRGWMPRDQLDRTRIQAAAPPPGLVWVHGRLATSLSRAYELGAAAESGPIRQNVDVAAYAQETRLRLRPLPVVQESSPGAEVDGLLRDWPAPATGIEKHHGYAFQWFAVSALSAGLWLWFDVIRPRRQRRAQSAQPQR